MRKAKQRDQNAIKPIFYHLNLLGRPKRRQITYNIRLKVKNKKLIWCIKTRVKYPMRLTQLARILHIICRDRSSKPEHPISPHLLMCDLG